MIPSQTLEEFEPFAESGDKVAPVPAKYAQGYLPGEVFPAQHENYLMGKASRCSEQHRAGLRSVEAELNNIVMAGGAEPSDSIDNQVLAAINYLIAQAETRAKLAAHPVHSLFWTSAPPTITVDNVEQANPEGDPRLLFGGGTWVRIKDTLIWAAGDNDTVQPNVFTKEDGALDVSLVCANLPDHHHAFAGSSATTASQSTDTSGSTSVPHMHKLNNGNTSTSGTTTNAGIRMTSSSTGPTSVQHTHTLNSHTHTLSSGGTGSTDLSHVHALTGTGITSGSGGTSATASASTKSGGMWQFALRRFSDGVTDDFIVGTNSNDVINIEYGLRSGTETGNRIDRMMNTSPSYTRVKHPGHTHTITLSGYSSGEVYKSGSSYVARTMNHSHSLTGSTGSPSNNSTSTATAESGAYISHTHTMPSLYIYGNTDKVASTDTGNYSTSHTHSYSHTHTLTATGKATGVKTTSDADFTQTAVSIKNPRLKRYCWERTA